MKNAPKPMTVQQFFAAFPDDATCLDHLMETRFGKTIECPKCWKKGNFSRLTKIPAYSCPNCGHHVHPMAETPFAKSSTSLQKWFYAMYLFTTSRHGVPAKELQRQLGVTYKTAWRMAHEIRKYMAAVDGTGTLSGEVEIDETLVGGRNDGEGHGAHFTGKTIVFGMVERGGELQAYTTPDTRGKTLIPVIEAVVEEGSVVMTDEASQYNDLNAGFDHQRVNHRRREYVRGNVHTNTIEGFWAMLKRSIRGTHIHVSGEHLPKYLGEFEYRWNNRHAAHLMFDRLLAAF